MMPKRKSLSLRQIQWIIWLLLLGIQVLSLTQYDPLVQALTYSVISVGFMAVTIYGNAALFLPRLYEKDRKLLYVLIVILFLAAITLAKYGTSFYVYNRFFAEKPTPFRWKGIIGTGISTVFTYLSSILFYIALNYFKLKQQQEQLKKRHAEAELNLLKAQVQPHFLFNTLNNIYFVAQRESPATAALLEQLSQIMRYFVDEAPKERISLCAEISFIRSYIELEKMRMRFPLQVSIQEEGNMEAVAIPPMLLIPLVENVFKHGIDKRREDNYLTATISLKEERLYVRVENRWLSLQPEETKSGIGLHNLKCRLQLLFRDDFVLQHDVSGTIFTTQLSIPA